MKHTLILILLLNTATTFAQERKILGRVIDQDTKKPVKNAVIVVGEQEKAVSNFIGYFELTVNEQEQRSISISHVSHAAITIEIPKEEKFQVSMQSIRPMLFPVYLDEYPKKISNSSTFIPANANEIPAMPVEGKYDVFTDRLGNALYKSADGSKLKVDFTVDSNGKIINLHPSDSTSQLGIASVKAFKDLPAWNPAKQKGAPVAANYSIEISSTGPKEAVEKILTDIKKSFRYPERARRMGSDGFVDIVFSVTPDGKVDKTTILKDVDGGCGDELARRIREVTPAMLKALMDATGKRNFLFTAVLGLGNTPTRIGRVVLVETYSLPELMYIAQ